MDPWVIISDVSCLMLYPVCLRKGFQEFVPVHSGEPLLVLLPATVTVFRVDTVLRCIYIAFPHSLGLFLNILCFEFIMKPARQHCKKKRQIF